ncbi:MAG: hypothetical protein GXP25_02050, partial [Planctomycetes bacterium]|nr:hypothetical protein [Planctomycetota bacterium]
MTKRIHKTLELEELEARVAPVTLTGTASGAVYQFTDTDGDAIRIGLQGTGKAEITWVNGGSTPSARDEIASVELFNTSKDIFTIADANPNAGGDTLTGGNIWTSGSVYELHLLSTFGTVENTGIQIAGDAATINVEGKVQNVDTYVGKSLSSYSLGVAHDSDLYVRGSVGTISTMNLTDCSFRVDGDASTVQVGGPAGTAAADNFNLYVAGQLGHVTFGPHVQNSVIAAGKIRSAVISGSIENCVVAGFSGIEG